MEKLIKSDVAQNTIELLKMFKGFDAYGYFKLGRPLLTTIVANFMTYVIILVQFKFYEKGDIDDKVSFVETSTPNCTWESS